MSWFSSRGPSGAKGDAVKAQRQPAETEGQSHRSLALAALLKEIRQDRKLQVLDLGPAVGSNVEFLSRFDCKIYIEDLYAALSSRQPSGGETEEAGAQFFADFLPLPESARIDVVLAWDRFDYLTRKELRRFVEHLGRFCHAGTYVFALISYGKTIPAQPMRFRILDEETLLYEPVTAATRPSPRYAPAELNDILKGFRVGRSFLLRHGIQEYLFVHE
jgi:hypothetical protein